MNNISNSNGPLPINSNNNIQKSEGEQKATKIIINLPEDLSVQKSALNESIEIEELNFNSDSDIDSYFETIENGVNQLDELMEILPAISEKTFPSLSEQMNKWGNEELSLMYHEFQLAKQLTAGPWQVAEALDMGVKVGAKRVAPYVRLAGGYIPSFADTSMKIEKEIYGVALAYKIPAELSKVSVLVYKHIFLSRMEKMLDLNPPNMTDAQKTEFREWMDAEKKEVSKAAITIVKDIGFSLPGNLVTLIRVCQFNVPLLRLGLAWTDGILGPISASLELRAASKAAIKVQRDINQFHEQIYRRTTVETKDTNAVINAMQNRADIPEEILQAAIEHRMSLDEQNLPAEQVREQVLEDIHSGGELHADEVIQAALYQRTGQDAAVIRNNRREALLERRGENMPKSDVSFETGFARLIEEALNKADFDEAKNFLEQEGLSIDPGIKTLAALENRLQEVKFRDDMLARYIDVKGTQQMTDSVRNALKNLTVKKQSILKIGALANLAKSKILLIATVICSVTAITLTTIAATGLVAVPLIAFFIPGFGMLGLGGVLLTVGIVKFYKNSPNLFSEYVKMSIVKIGVYNIPKGIHEIRKSILNIKMFKNSIATRELQAKNNLLADDDLRKANTENIEDMNAKAIEMEQKMARINSKIAHWDEKIKPLAQGVAKAKWMDFMQERPKRVKAEGRPAEVRTFVTKGMRDFAADEGLPLDKDALRAMIADSTNTDARKEAATSLLQQILEHEEKTQPLGSMTKQRAEEEITEIVSDIKTALTAGTSVIDKELCQLARDRLNYDIELMRGPENDPALQAAILRFVP